MNLVHCGGWSSSSCAQRGSCLANVKMGLLKVALRNISRLLSDLLLLRLIKFENVSDSIVGMLQTQENTIN